MNIKRKSPPPDEQISADQKKAEGAADRIRQAPCHWLSEAESLCRKAFMPDIDHLERCRARVIARTFRAAAPPEIVEPANRKGQLNVLSASNAVTGKWATNRALTTEEESQARVLARGRIDRRDLLAARIGRESATKRWQACPSDQYTAGGNAYRRRLAAIGEALDELGWLTAPEINPWRKSPPRRSDMDERQRDAEANAAAMVGM